MASSVCTLFEGHYHYGVGALVNSLYRQGYRGTVWAGYRGALPAWAAEGVAGERFFQVEVAEGFHVRFIPLATDRHLTHFKPDFMLHVLGEQPEISAVFYVDPDVTIRCPWSFFEKWARRGIALIEDITNGTMPANHPLRLEWIEFGASLGMGVKRDLAQYFNGGFVGVSREFESFLFLWKKALDALEERGVNLRNFMAPHRSDPFFAADQDTLNLTAMATEHPISTIGPEGMDFVPGGFTMSHCVGQPKPWKKAMTRSALAGWRPSPADHGYLAHAEHPIRLYSKWELLWRRLDLLCGAAVGRLWNRA